METKKIKSKKNEVKAIKTEKDKQTTIFVSGLPFDFTDDKL